MSFAKKFGKSRPIDVPGSDLCMLAEHLHQIPVGELVKMGGFYMYAKEGQGIILPPLHLVAFVNPFQLNNPPCGEVAGETVAHVLESRLCFSGVSGEG